MAVDSRECGVRMGADGLHRGVERVRDERLRLGRKGLVRDVADVVPGGEDLALARDHDAADFDPAVELRHHLGERTEDVVIERVAPGRV